MTPLQFKYFLDLLTLFIGGYVVIQVSRAAIGGALGIAFRFILIGIAILAFNHFLDTVFLGTFLHDAGHMTDFLQASIVHRLINLVGFLFIAFGYTKLAASKK
jgi:hypothetical protein